MDAILFLRKEKIRNAVRTTKRPGDCVTDESELLMNRSKFRSRTFDMNDQERSGKPTILDDNPIKTLVKNNQTTGDLVDMIHISPMSFIRYLKTLGYVIGFFFIW